MYLLTNVPIRSTRNDSLAYGRKGRSLERVRTIGTAMSTKARTKGKDDYLFKRGNRWYLKLQAPKGLVDDVIQNEPYCGQRMRVIALGTEIYDEAVIAAAPYIQKHNIQKLLWRNIREKKAGFKIGSRFAPGQLHTSADGEQFIATETELIFYGRDGKENRREPNPLDMGLTLAFLSKSEEEIANAFDKEN